MIAALLSLLRDWATMALGREIAARTLRRASETALLFAVMAILSAASLIFFYIFAYRWIAARLDDESAAAILCGANLLLIALILAIRAVAASLGRGREDPARSPGPELQELLEIGLALERRLRDKAPLAALIAVIAGLAIGARPELLDIFKSSAKPKGRDRSEREERG